MGKVEQVLGGQLRPGDLIWNESYIWRVKKTQHEVYTLIHGPEVRRWCVWCEWSGTGTDPKFFTDNIGFARREDLTWPRIPVCEGCAGAGEVQVDTLPNGAWDMQPCPICQPG